MNKLCKLSSYRAFSFSFSICLHLRHVFHSAFHKASTLVLMRRVWYGSGINKSIAGGSDRIDYGLFIRQVCRSLRGFKKCVEFCYTFRPQREDYPEASLNRLVSIHSAGIRTIKGKIQNSNVSLQHNQRLLNLCCYNLCFTVKKLSDV